MENGVWIRWFSQGVMILALIYLTVLVSSGGCATTRSTNNCYNETTQVKINVTEEELCSTIGLTYCWAVGSCYCNVTREEVKTHVTNVCKELTVVDGDGLGEAGGSSGKRNLTDPEVAAIAVISSLVFSILLSLTVFCVQRRCRLCTQRKNARTQVVQVERGGAGDSVKLSGEDERFLPPSVEKQYIRVEAANREQNVYEDVQNRNGEFELSMKSSGSLPARREQAPLTVNRINTNPSGVNMTDGTMGSKRHSADSTTQTEPSLLNCTTTSTHNNPNTNTPSPVPFTSRNGNASPTPSTPLSKMGDSESSPRLSGSEDHYENVSTSVL